LTNKKQKQKSKKANPSEIAKNGNVGCWPSKVRKWMFALFFVVLDER
jgi:hypothetical protein